MVSPHSIQLLLGISFNKCNINEYDSGEFRGSAETGNFGS